MGASLSEDDIAGNYQLLACLFGTKPFSRTLCCFVGATLRCVGRMAELCAVDGGDGA